MNAEIAIIQQDFFSRARELCSTRAPWNRRLWRTSTLQLAEDLLNECHNSDIPTSALKTQSKALLYALSTDPGISDRGQAIKPVISRFTEPTSTTSHQWFTLNAYVEYHALNYLNHWAEIWEDFENNAPSRLRILDPESSARRIIAHLLDKGFSKEGLYTWLSEHARQRPLSVSSFLREAAERERNGPRTYSFLVPFHHLLPEGFRTKGKWWTASATAQWKTENLPSAGMARQEGSAHISVKGFDIYGALSAARSEISSFQTALDLCSTKPVKFGDEIWSIDRCQKYPISSTTRSIRVENIRHRDLLTRSDNNALTPINNALALVHPLRDSPPHIALLSAWSAIESLMVGTGDDSDHVAAFRFSQILAVGLIHAECTALSQSWARTHSEAPATQIREAADPLEAARIFFHLAQNTPCDTSLQFKNRTDALALTRIKPALSNPLEAINKTTQLLEREFLRLYRKRNLIAHAGFIEDRSLTAFAETIAPLIGAGFDLLTYGAIQFSLSPIELSAHVGQRILRLSSEDPINVLALYEF